MEAKWRPLYPQGTGVKSVVEINHTISKIKDNEVKNKSFRFDMQTKCNNLGKRPHSSFCQFCVGQNAFNKLFIYLAHCLWPWSTCHFFRKLSSCISGNLGNSNLKTKGYGCKLRSLKPICFC